MRASAKLRLLAALLTPLAVGACAQATSTPAPAPPPTTANPSNEEIEAIFRARTDSARMRFTDADVRFMQHMIHHHAQAIEVSRMAPARTTTPSIQTLAARIINAQQDEIATMQRWLRDRGQAVPELHITDSAVMVHGGHHPMDMPGMLSAGQISNLAAAQGTAFDRLFLTLMIEHHSGAVTMVHDLFATDGAGQDEDVFRFAADVQVDQATEVARMQLMLSAMDSDRSR
ncbi:MAG: DUF305 domain-containing protein [Gemmatimonadetes bacterium]|nr:DUF305 domain-containing protein [Gemmatimonadota bacterium]